ncbi:MAG TPA: FeoA family protein [Synergistaceae bacterium]|nr:FeoA family protein [Synergistaceae bacterium]HPQ37196.1 FeoA family protein [Synergistaceae bacterium]
MRLNELSPGTKAFVKKVHARGMISQRLRDFGFFPGVEVEVLRCSPLKDPVEFLVESNFISIRHEEAHCVEVTE